MKEEGMSWGEWTLNFDGAIQGGNPGGTPTWGWVLAWNGETVATGRGVAEGPKTSNVVEYAGLIEGLKALAKRGIADALVRGDSELIIKQVTGVYRCRQAHLVPLWEEARGLASGHVFRWVPREQNAEADGLARKAYEEAKGERL